ncbi:MAG TPA: hypothetical protein VK956_20060, partial [Verrucomicrobium sp.]|nr:hypothetical protein [Verrucomicrobium sp.]
MFRSYALCLAVALMMLGAPAVSAAVTDTGDTYLVADTYVGYFSEGSLTVDAGSTYATNMFYVATTASGIGTLTATGSGSTITANSQTYIGYGGVGVLNITSGAVFFADGASEVAQSGAFGVGYTSTGNGTVNVSGTGSTLTLSDILFLGHSGTGTINLSSGATMTTNKTVYLGASTGKGTLNISSGAVLTSNGTSGFPNPSIINIGNTAAGASSATVDG